MLENYMDIELDEEAPKKKGLTLKKLSLFGIPVFGITGVGIIGLTAMVVCFLIVCAAFCLLLCSGGVVSVVGLVIFYPKINPTPAPTPTPTPKDFEESVILISFDSFRSDYLTMYPDNSKTLQSIKSQGVSLRKLVSSFPSKTFPNHYSIATGLYPDNHGIVSNTMRDPRRPGVTFTISGTNPESKDPFWWQGEPIWVTAEKQGMKTGCVFWPGSEVKINGTYPSYWNLYDSTMTPTARVDKILSYLDLPKDKRPRFMTLYFEHVDDAGHYYSPNSDQVNSAIKVVDSAVAYLLAEIEKRGISDKINLIFVSDHGMTPTPAEKIINVDKIVNDNSGLSFGFDDCFDTLNDGPLLDIWVKPNSICATNQTNLEEIVKNLKNLDALKAHSQTFFKADIPERFHHKTNLRIPDIMMLADDEYSLCHSVKSHYTIKGNHGYDPLISNMQALFLAKGPAFKSGGIEFEPFENIQIYNLIANILKLNPAPNDGNFTVVAQLLKN